VLRNVAIPLISVIGVQFGYMLGGSIYIESIFAWPGIGQLLEQAIGWRDFPLSRPSPSLPAWSCWPQPADRRRLRSDRPEDPLWPLDNRSYCRQLARR
jgi:hypothetical protein